MLRAPDPDGCECRAIGADRPAAVGAREACLAVRVAEADRHPEQGSLQPVRIDVAFTPGEAAATPVAVVVDVIRASSTIVQALAAGYRRVLCCREIDEARELRAKLPEAVVGGERYGVKVDGFDVGGSPREFVEPRAETLIYSSTNGTSAILT